MDSGMRLSTVSVRMQCGVRACMLWRSSRARTWTLLTCRCIRRSHSRVFDAWARIRCWPRPQNPAARSLATPHVAPRFHALREVRVRPTHGCLFDRTQVREERSGACRQKERGRRAVICRRGCGRGCGYAYGRRCRQARGRGRVRVR